MRLGPCRLISCVLIFALVSVSVFATHPGIVLAQEEAEAAETTTGVSDACTAGQEDAKTFNSGVGFVAAGFLCGIFGFGSAAIYTPKPPAERVVGKSADYVVMYSSCYEKEAKNKNMKMACIGWAVGAAVTLAILAATGSFS